MTRQNPLFFNIIDDACRRHDHKKIYIYIYIYLDIEVVSKIPTSLFLTNLNVGYCCRMN